MTTISMATDRLACLSGRPGAPERAGFLKREASPEELVVAYHERTKHHVHRYAAALGYMDWATQPDPFRRYAGAELVRLPLPKAGRSLPYWQLYAVRVHGVCGCLPLHPSASECRPSPELALVSY